jgi:hypothetical protein
MLVRQSLVSQLLVLLLLRSTIVVATIASHSSTATAVTDLKKSTPQVVQLQPIT